MSCGCSRSAPVYSCGLTSSRKVSDVPLVSAGLGESGSHWLRLAALSASLRGSGGTSGGLNEKIPADGLYCSGIPPTSCVYCHCNICTHISKSVLLKQDGSIRHDVPTEMIKANILAFSAASSMASLRTFLHVHNRRNHSVTSPAMSFLYIFVKHKKDQTVPNPTCHPAPGAGHGSSPALTTATLS